jgi:hypothetical protein
LARGEPTSDATVAFLDIEQTRGCAPGAVRSRRRMALPDYFARLNALKKGAARCERSEKSETVFL